jgi:hypothetical protein
MILPVPVPVEGAEEAGPTMARAITRLAMAASKELPIARANLGAASPMRPAEENPARMELVDGGAINLATPEPAPTVGWVVETSICKNDRERPLASPKTKEGVNMPRIPTDGILDPRRPNKTGCGTTHGIGTPLPTPADPVSIVDTVT